MTTVKYVNQSQMERETGSPLPLGYSQPDKNRVLIRKGLSNQLAKEVKAHEFDHMRKGEEGPFLGALLGGVAAGLIGNSGSSKAAKTQASAANNATQAQLEQYYQTREDMQPWQNVGRGAVNQLGALYGIPSYQDTSGIQAQIDELRAKQGGGEFDSQSFRDFWAGQPEDEFGHRDFNTIYNEYLKSRPTANQNDYSKQIAELEFQLGQAQQPGEPDYSSFYNSPDYQFALQQGEQGTNRLAAATGRLGAGSHFKDMSRFNQGLASQQYGNYTNRLSNLAGLGQTANQSLGQFGANAATNAGNNMMQAGNARASGYLGQGNTLANIVGGIGNYYDGQQRLNSDVNNLVLNSGLY